MNVRALLAVAATLALLLPTLPLRSEQRGVEVTANVTYSLTGRFLLVNRHNFTVRDHVYLPLPQNTTYQRSFVLSIQPRPLYFARDEDGNTYAVLLVEAKPLSRLWVNASYSVTVLGYRLRSAPSVWPPLELVRRYTSSGGYWNIYNETLITLAYRVAYADSPLEVARKLAEWTVRRVDYKVMFARLGSDKALVRRGLDYAIAGDCVEVTDVYVTMARILGLPARAAYGLLLTARSGRMWLNITTMVQEGDRIIEHWGGHMWPQVYLSGVGWVDVDMLDGLRPNVGIHSERHILFGVEETKFYGSALSSVCTPSMLSLLYVEYEYSGEGK